MPVKAVRSIGCERIVGRNVFGSAAAYFCYSTFINAEMETSKNGSSKLIAMSVLEPKDELDEVKFSLKFICKM